MVLRFAEDITTPQRSTTGESGKAAMQKAQAPRRPILSRAAPAC